MAAAAAAAEPVAIARNDVAAATTSVSQQDDDESVTTEGADDVRDDPALTKLVSVVAGFERANHEPAANIPPRREKSRLLQFQDSWYKSYPWLHYSPTLSGVVCFVCAKAHASGILKFETKAEPTFINSGFFNWKKAIQKFTAHQNSSCHKQAVLLLHQTTAGQPIVAQLSTAHQKQQQVARRCLLKAVQSTKYLLRQGLAFRGHVDDDSNFHQLLKMQAETDVELRSWLQRTTNFTSHECVEEIQNIFADSVLRTIIADIKNQSKIFGIVVDGTQDINSKEQLSLCVRYVDSDLHVHEDFIGLYQQDDTSGRAIAATIDDMICRVGLDMNFLRAQTYDGGANMDGKYNGCQAIIRDRFPLALHFRCAAHSVHLVAQHATEADAIIQDCLQWVQEVDKLFKRSTKFHRIFETIVTNSGAAVHSSNIKPLCPTRWLCRHSCSLVSCRQI